MPPTHDPGQGWGTNPRPLTGYRTRDPAVLGPTLQPNWPGLFLVIFNSLYLFLSSVTDPFTHHYPFILFSCYIDYLSSTAIIYSLICVYLFLCIDFLMRFVIYPPLLSILYLLCIDYVDALISWCDLSRTRPRIADSQRFREHAPTDHASPWLSAPFCLAGHRASVRPQGGCPALAAPGITHEDTVPGRRAGLSQDDALPWRLLS